MAGWMGWLALSVALLNLCSLFWFAGAFAYYKTAPVGWYMLRKWWPKPWRIFFFSQFALWVATCGLIRLLYYFEEFEDANFLLLSLAPIALLGGIGILIKVFAKQPSKKMRYRHKRPSRNSVLKVDDTIYQALKERGYDLIRDEKLGKGREVFWWGMTMVKATAMSNGLNRNPSMSIIMERQQVDTDSEITMTLLVLDLICWEHIAPCQAWVDRESRFLQELLEENLQDSPR